MRSLSSQLGRQVHLESESRDLSLERSEKIVLLVSIRNIDVYEERSRRVLVSILRQEMNVAIA